MALKRGSPQTKCQCLSMTQDRKCTKKKINITNLKYVKKQCQTIRNTCTINTHTHTHTHRHTHTHTHHTRTHTHTHTHTHPHDQQCQAANDQSRGRVRAAGRQADPRALCPVLCAHGFHYQISESLCR